MTGSESLTDRILARLRDHPVVAAVAVAAAILAGVASVTDSFQTIRSAFPGDKVPDAPPPPPPREKAYFTKDFSLGEDGVFVDHGVTVRVGKIGILDGPFAGFGASASGPVEYLDEVRPGAERRLFRPDCDSLVVLVKSIEVSPPAGMTFDNLQGMPPSMQESLVTRKVTGQIAGHCEE